MTIVELCKIKRKLFKSYRMHKLYSLCKGHYRYSKLVYDMFDMAATIGYDVVLMNSKIPMMIR